MLDASIPAMTGNMRMCSGCHDFTCHTKVRMKLLGREGHIEGLDLCEGLCTLCTESFSPSICPSLPTPSDDLSASIPLSTFYQLSRQPTHCCLVSLCVAAGAFASVRGLAYSTTSQVCPQQSASRSSQPLATSLCWSICDQEDAAEKDHQEEIPMIRAG